MVDDTKDPGPHDGYYVNIRQEHEIRYWTKRFGVTEERLREAVKKVGVTVDAVAAELKVGEDGKAQSDDIA